MYESQTQVVSAQSVVEKINAKVLARVDRTGWTQRHLTAFALPRGPENIVGLLRAWTRYADRHSNRFYAPVGDCGVLGPAWESIGDSLRTMLKGELGRLDGGTMDSIILDVMASQGIEVEDK